MKAGAHFHSFALSALVLAAACRSAPPEGNRNPGGARVVDAAVTGEIGTPRGLEPCVEAWLRENKLDPYGHPEGTMYAGGTPLFDERTGERKDRLAYVLERHPEARRACADGGGL
jgi:hypothetical protein